MIEIYSHRGRRPTALPAQTRTAAEMAAIFRETQRLTPRAGHRTPQAEFLRLTRGNEQPRQEARRFRSAAPTAQPQRAARLRRLRLAEAEASLAPPARPVAKVTLSPSACESVTFGGAPVFDPAPKIYVGRSAPTPPRNSAAARINANRTAAVPGARMTTY